MRRLSAFAAVLSLAAACTEPTRPALRTSLLVQRDTLAATVTTTDAVSWIQFAMPVTVHNPATASLVLEYCTLGIDNRAGDQWRDVWSPICALSSGSPIEIPPGQTREFSVDVTAALHGPGGPKWGSDQVEGMYRLRAQVLPAGGDFAPTITSNTFALIQPH